MAHMVKVDSNSRWEEIQALSRKIASKDGVPTEIESALCGAVVRAREWLEELEATKELFAAARTRPEELSAGRGCPCLYTTPCKDNCTCVSWTSSAGCARCCTYGSLEQRTQNAERLASLTPSPQR